MINFKQDKELESVAKLMEPNVVLIGYLNSEIVEKNYKKWQAVL